MNNDDILLAIKNKNPVDMLIGKYISLKKAGSNYKGLCPFHNEKSPSFTVYTNTESYYCFGCGSGGDIVTFIRQIENLSYVDAIKFLAEQSGIDINFDTQNKDKNDYTKIYEINRAAARFYYNNLIKNKEAMNYLLDRGIKLETIKHFGLGFSNNNWSDLKIYLNSQKFKDEDILLSNLISKNKNGKYYDRFRNRIMFPIIDVRGNVIAFGGRVLPGNDGAKYINSSDTPVYKKSENLYSIQFAKKSKVPFILVEGYLDVISLHQAGFNSAVAALGTAFTKEQAKLIKRYSESVYVLLDSDGAGKIAANRAIDILSRQGLKIKVVSLNDCKDPDEYILKHGADNFKKLLKSADNSVDYKILFAKQSYDLNTTEGILEFINKCCEILAKEDIILQDIYATKLSDTYKISKKSILIKIENYNKKFVKNLKKEHLNSLTNFTFNQKSLNSYDNVHNNLLVAEENIIYLLTNFVEFHDIIINKVISDYFVTDFHKKVFAFLQNKIINNTKIELILFNEQFSQDEITKVTQLINKPVDKSTLDRLCNESIAFMVKEFEKSKADKLDLANDFKMAIDNIKQTKMGEQE